MPHGNTESFMLLQVDESDEGSPNNCSKEYKRGQTRRLIFNLSLLSNVLLAICVILQLPAKREEIACVTEYGMFILCEAIYTLTDGQRSWSAIHQSSSMPHHPSVQVLEQNRKGVLHGKALIQVLERSVWQRDGLKRNIYRPLPPSSGTKAVGYIS